MRKNKPFIYLHMSTRALLALSVFVLLGAGVLFFLISRNIVEPPVTQEEIRVEALYTDHEPTDEPSPVETPSPQPSEVPPSPTPSAEESAGFVALLSEYAVLVPGDDNRSVLLLRTRLAELGYMEDDEPSTLYNASVENAVKLFQRSCGLEMDGIADAELQSLLFSDSAIPYRIQRGDSGDDVSSVQSRLKELRFYSGRTTGYYGPQTEEAVKLFEYQNGLPSDGIIDVADWNQLFSYQAGPNLAADQEDDPLPSEQRASDYSYAHSAEGLSHAASDQLDRPYIWGKEGPDAFDNTGFIMYCLKLCGITVSKTGAAGFADISGWQQVEKMTLINKGDLLFFTSDSGLGITHVGISVGGTYFVHASSSKGKVVISSLTEDYWARNYAFGRRIFNG